MFLNLPFYARDCVYLLNVANEGVFVIFPVALQSLFRWKLFTAKLHGNLKAVAAEVIEILHSCQKKQMESQNMHVVTKTLHRLLC